MSNSYLPVSIAIADRKCLVIGGGSVALRKIETLLDYGASVTVIAAEPNERICYYGEKGLLNLIKREYRTPEAAEYDLVISACNDENVNRQSWTDCGTRGTLINVVDNPALCTFIFPAIVKRDDLTVAVSTGGRAPFLSGRLKVILEDIFPAQWVRIVRLAGKFREMVRGQVVDPGRRLDCYQLFLDTDWKEVLSKASDEEIDSVLVGLIQSAEKDSPGGDDAGPNAENQMEI